VTATTATPSRPALDWRRIVRRHGWTAGVALLLLVLVLYWRSSTNLPWSPFDVQSLAVDAMPLAFAAMAQSIVIISGGIDLSIGSMMSLVNVLAAKYMATSLGDSTVGSPATPGSFRRAILVSIVLILFGFLVGALTGLIIQVTRVADIIVTLAMLFILGGVALVVLEVPGGTTAPKFQNLVTIDTVLSDWLPKAIVILLAIYALGWLTIRRRRPGLALYAIGSNRNAAYLSGINVPLIRVFAYAMSGAFAACGGLALTAASGIGDPHAGESAGYTLNSVAAVVLGGVSLLGGIGGLIGPIMAAFILTLVKTILILKGVDQNYAQVIQGTLIVLVVMIGGLVIRQKGKTGR
jgi:ribose transport system permease protein